MSDSPNKSPPVEQKCAVLRKGDLQDIYGEFSSYRRLVTTRNEQTITSFTYGGCIRGLATEDIGYFGGVSSAKFRCDVFDK